MKVITRTPGGFLVEAPDGRRTDVSYQAETPEGLRALAAEERARAARLLEGAARADAVADYLAAEQVSADLAAEETRRAATSQAVETRRRKKDPFGLWGP